jgi:hypothetical protein
MCVRLGALQIGHRVANILKVNARTELAGPIQWNRVESKAREMRGNGVEQSPGFFDEAVFDQPSHHEQGAFLGNIDIVGADSKLFDKGCNASVTEEVRIHRAAFVSGPDARQLLEQQFLMRT